MVEHDCGLSVCRHRSTRMRRRITVNDVQAVLDVVQPGYDYVMVDTPPFFEERILTALDWADHVLSDRQSGPSQRQAPQDGVQDHGPDGVSDEKLFIVMNRADSKVGLEVSEVEQHLGRR